MTWERQNSSKHLQRPRIALGVFDDMDALRSAVKGLSLIGIPASELVIVANSDAINGMQKKFLANADSDDLDLPPLLVRSPGKHAAFVRAPVRSGGLADWSGCHLAEFEIWAPPPLSDSLSAHLNAGACVLIAPVANAKAEREISEILLHTSADRVQLHDVMYTPRRRG